MSTDRIPCAACRRTESTTFACVELSDGARDKCSGLAYSVPKLAKLCLCADCSALVLGRFATRLDTPHEIKCLLTIREIQAEKAQARAEALT
jgi:hypothetical protein